MILDYCDCDGKVHCKNLKGDEIIYMLDLYQIPAFFSECQRLIRKIKKPSAVEVAFTLVHYLSITV